MINHHCNTQMSSVYGSVIFFLSQIQSTDNLTLKPPTTLVGPHAESGSITPAMETTVNKHPGISHLGFHNTAEVSSGLFLNSASQREEALSPASSMDFLTSPASSKESILSEGWDKERSWSALHMFSRDGSPGPFSRTVSPCSSVRSGTFTPSVVRIKRLSLAPGSSLLQMSSVCGTPCDSRTASPCPLSPSARHRTPPTQLSLLTAILRKGRLPVLSSSTQRPYTPCWPISPVNTSSCLACSAASSVAPMNVSKAKSCTSIDTKSFQIWKPELVKAPDESPLMKPPERPGSCRHFTSASSIILPTNHISSPSSPAVQAASAHLSKSGPKGNRLPTVPSSLLCSSNSCTRSPKLNYLSCSSNENHKNPSVSGDCPVSLDPNKSGESLKHNDETKLHDRPRYSLPLKQSQKSPELSNEPYLKHIGSSSDNLDSSVPKPALSSCKSSSPTLKHTFESHSNSRSPVLSHKVNKQSALFQNARINDVERVHLSSPDYRLSPSPRPMGLARLSYTPPASPACPPVHPSSRSSTPDRCTLSPSPAVLSRQLSPSPSYSFCSSPSPSLWGSTPDCADGDCKNRKVQCMPFPCYLQATCMPYHWEVALIPAVTCLRHCWETWYASYSCKSSTSLAKGKFCMFRVCQQYMHGRDVCTAISGEYGFKLFPHDMNADWDILNWWWCLCWSAESILVFVIFFYNKFMHAFPPVRRKNHMAIYYW